VQEPKAHNGLWSQLKKKKTELGSVYSRHTMYDKYMKNFGEPEGKTQLGRRMRKGGNNSKLSTKQTGHEGVGQTELAYNDNTVAGSFESSNEASGSTKCRGIQRLFERPFASQEGLCSMRLCI
jgi:hypothetical protein